MTDNDSALQEMVDECASKLREHCDSVVVVVTESREGDTHQYVSYLGNYYACVGSAEAFVAGMCGGIDSALFGGEGEDLLDG